MFIATAKKALIFSVPLAILAAAFFVLPKIPALTPSHRELLLISPYLAAVTGMFLSVHFHRGRPFTALFLLSLLYFLCRAHLGEGVIGFAHQELYLGLSLLLPFNFALLAVMREKGVFSVAGRLRFGFILFQTASVWLLFRHYFEELLPLLTRRLFPFEVLDSLLLPQPLLLLSILCMLIIAYVSAKRQAPVESGLLGALAAVIITISKITSPDIPAIFCLAAGVIITFSILQDSYNMAFRDDLTGMPSRRALNENLHGLGRRYVVAMLDVDHFKRFNDTYGHDVGDQVLKMVAKKMLSVGGGGKAFRYGGEEFTILFPGKRIADTLPYLEEVRMAIEKYSLAIRSDDRPKDTKQGQSKRGSRSGLTEVSVTISIGVAESGEGHGSPAEVMKASDKALYRAKSKGRNQVCS
jgi:diguanylate cyclase (GGDEF)-like protein